MPVDPSRPGPHEEFRRRPSSPVLMSQHRASNASSPPLVDMGRESVDELLPTYRPSGGSTTTTKLKGGWQTQDKIMAVGIAFSVILGISGFLQFWSTRDANKLAQRSSDLAAEANRIAQYNACQGEFASNTSYCTVILSSGPGSLPRGDMSAQDLEYPRDVEFFGRTFDHSLVPLLEARLDLHRRLEGFVKANVSSSDTEASGDTQVLGHDFRELAQAILDSERDISQVLSLRTPSPPPAPPAPKTSQPADANPDALDKTKARLHNPGVLYMFVGFIAFMISVTVVSKCCFVRNPEAKWRVFGARFGVIGVCIFMLCFIFAAISAASDRTSG